MTKALQDGTRWTSQRARLKDAMVYRRVHPGVDPEHWYQVVDPGELGFFIELSGSLRFVWWTHFEVLQEKSHD